MYRHRLTRAAALGLALGALAAPVAGAQTGRDLSSPDARDAALAAQTPQDLRSPDARDAAEGRYLDKSPRIMVIKVRQKPLPAPADGIDWGDVGIGAGGLLGLSLVAFGSAGFVVHRRRAVHNATPAAGL
jgi:hypothetical protein